MSTSMLRRQMKNIIQNFSEAEIKVREATSNDPWGPSSSLMAEISDLTYNVVACTEIMNMLWKRLNDHGKNWRHVYKALTLLEYLLKTGSDRVIQQCKENIYTVQTLKEFQYIDRDGKDQGVNVREKAKQLVTLVKDEEKLKEERSHALKTKEKMAQAQTTTSSTTTLPSVPGLRVGALGNMGGIASLSSILQGTGSAANSAEGKTSAEEGQAKSKEETAEKEEGKSKSDAVEEGQMEKPKAEEPSLMGTATAATATPATTTTTTTSDSEPWSSSDPWDGPPPAPPSNSDPWGGGGATVDTSSDPWGDTSSAKNDPWGSTAASPPSGDPWGAPAAPAASASTSDPWGGDGGAPATGASTSDPWGGDGGAPPASVSTNDPWGGDGGAPAASVSTNDPWGGDGGAPAQESSTSDPWGGPAKDTTNGAANVEPSDPAAAGGEDKGNAGSTATFDLSSMGTSLPAKKTPESFLGANAGLVDLDSLVSFKPKPKQSAPPMNASSTPSPFMQSQGTSPVPGMAVSSGSTISRLGVSPASPSDSNPFGSAPLASVSPQTSSLGLSHFHTSPVPPSHILSSPLTQVSSAMLGIAQIIMAMTAMRAQVLSRMGPSMVKTN